MSLLPLPSHTGGGSQGRLSSSELGGSGTACLFLPRRALGPLCAGPTVRWGSELSPCHKHSRSGAARCRAHPLRLASAQPSQWSPLSSSITGVLLQETPSHGGKGALLSVITKLSCRSSLAHAGYKAYEVLSLPPSVSLSSSPHGPQATASLTRWLSGRAHLRPPCLQVPAHLCPSLGCWACLPPSMQPARLLCDLPCCTCPMT